MRGRVRFELTEPASEKRCDRLCETKGATAAAQVVRMAIREG